MVAFCFLRRVRVVLNYILRNQRVPGDGLMDRFACYGVKTGLCGSGDFFKVVVKGLGSRRRVRKVNRCQIGSS